MILMMCSLALLACSRGEQNKDGNNETALEPQRPTFHFSPKSGWMNDPNGMVYLNGKYHLFFQHNPDTNVWGPMHWGHAISTDLVHWEEQPIALFPDSLGTIFSGSAVVDKDNTAGFGKDALIAIFTHHSHEIEEAKTGLHQNQSLAYSSDEGKTWKKYAGNPVLLNPGIWDFRDPKVMWHEASQQWIMTLATKQCITFYGSPNLKEWKRLSEFGGGMGAHGGVWECPDLFSLSIEGQKKWVLIVSINPGAPNGGSGTQYFMGDFDGKNFVSDHQDARWLDYGPDDYAGITWSNTGDRKLFIGWMNNWQYANQVPTTPWRGAATIARELKLNQVDGNMYLGALPVEELDGLVEDVHTKENVKVSDNDLSDKIKSFGGSYIVQLSEIENEDFAIHLTNSLGEEVVVGYDKGKHEYYVDRTKAGNTAFETSYARKSTAPRLLKNKSINMNILVDVASVEVFADDGLTVLTSTFFPSEVFTGLHIRAPQEIKMKVLTYGAVKSIYE